MTDSVEGKLPPLVLVTGAAHRLGRAIALRLASRGFAIALHHHRSSDAAQSTAEEIRSLGCAVLQLQADLLDPEQIEQMFDSIAQSPYSLQGLVNSAAVMPSGRLDSLAVEDWDKVFDLNVRAAWICSQMAARLILPGKGWIVNITDAGTSKLWTGYAAYSLSKSTLKTLTRLLARTYAPNIRVNSVAPGLILPGSDVSPDVWEKLHSRLPLQASGSPEDIASAVLYLVDSPAITGQELVIDGGYQLT